MVCVCWCAQNNTQWEFYLQVNLPHAFVVLYRGVELLHDRVHGTGEAAAPQFVTLSETRTIRIEDLRSHIVSAFFAPPFPPPTSIFCSTWKAMGTHMVKPFTRGISTTSDDRVDLSQIKPSPQSRSPLRRLCASSLEVQSLFLLPFLQVGRFQYSHVAIFAVLNVKLQRINAQIKKSLSCKVRDLLSEVTPRTDRTSHLVAASW